MNVATLGALCFIVYHTERLYLYTYLYIYKDPFTRRKQNGDKNIYVLLNKNFLTFKSGIYVILHRNVEQHIKNSF